MNDEEITNRAQFALDEARARYLAATGQRLADREIGRRLAESLHAKVWPELDEFQRNRLADKATKDMRRMLGIEKDGLRHDGTQRYHAKNPWTSPMARAFEKAMALAPGYLDGESRIDMDAKNGASVTEYGWGSVFGPVLEGAKVPSSELYRLRDQLKHMKQNPPLFKLVLDVSDVILHEPDPQKAAGTASHLILGHPATAIARKRRPKKSSKKP